MNELLGGRIKALRSAANFTQEQIADQIGISRQKYARIESGTNNITLDVLAKIANVLKVQVGDITRVLDETPIVEYRVGDEKASSKKIFDMLETVIENHAMRIQTGVLNEILMEAVALQQPPSDKGKRLKLFYMTQVSTKPPTFVLFVNKKELMHFSYQRYIENRIRDTFGFMGTPIRIFIKERKEKE